MRLTIAKKISISFSIMVAISLLMAGGVFFSNHSFDDLKEDLDAVQEFQQQTEALEYLERTMVLLHQTPSDDRLNRKFSQVHDLAAHIDQLLQKHLGPQVDDRHVLTQIQQYKEVNLELFHLYRKSVSSAEKGQKIWELLIQRTRILPDELRLQLDPLLKQILIGQLQQIDKGNVGARLSRIDTIGEQLLGRIDDPKIQTDIKDLLETIKENITLHQTIADQEQRMIATSENFERHIRQAISELSGKIMAQRMLMRRAIIILSLLLISFVLLSWRLFYQYSLEFLTAMRFSISAIRQGDFDFIPPPIRNDEFGDQILFVKEMAVSLKENLVTLADSERRFRGLVENISDWIWVIDAQNICRYSSPQGVAIIERNGTEIIGCSAEELLGISHSPKTASIFTEIAAQRAFDNLIHGVFLPDGDMKELETSGRPVIDADNKFQGYRFISRDISASREADRILHDNALAQQFHNAILGISLLDLDLDDILGRFLEVVLAPSWLGVEPVGAVFLVSKNGRSLELRVQKGLNENVLISCGIVPFGVCLCGQAAQTGRVVFCNTVDDRHEITFEGMHLHGHYCVPMHSVAGEVIGVFTVYLKEGTARDSRVEAALNNAATILGGIIKRRQAEEKLHTLNVGLEAEVAKRTAQLTAANKELDTFAYSVSHDLRAPLRAIDGFSLALLEDCHDMLDEDGRGYLVRIRKGCSRMARLIEDILKLSRLTRGEIKREELDLSAMASEILEVLRQGESKRHVECLIAPNLRINADPVMMRAVLDNLLGNAWKYTSKVESAQIVFSAKEENGTLVYCVKDNGAGFDMAYQEKLFTAFQRLHSSEEFEGSGIGLATVQRIIHRHDGKIWAEAEEGKGAAFYFSL